MSAELYAIRLYWDGRAGCARFDDVHLVLRSCPMPAPIAEVDFAPAVCVYQVREAHGGRRDMTPAEMRLAAQVLSRIAAAARAAIPR